MIHSKCPHCATDIRAADEHAGKKVRCPACKEVLMLPEGAAPILIAPVPETPPAPVLIREGPPAPMPRRRREDDYEDDEEEDWRGRPRGRRRSGGREGEYADCPECGARGDAKRVSFTWWGGALGPWMFCHVRCNECGATYNGRTGNSNTPAIVIYTVVALFITILITVLWIVLMRH